MKRELRLGRVKGELELELGRAEARKILGEFRVALETGESWS